MKQHDTLEKNTTKRKGWGVAAVTGLFAAIGAVLGMVAYYRQWLG